MTAPHPDDYSDGYTEGSRDMMTLIADVLAAPQTDDPIDVLNAVADLCEMKDYDYFAGRGQWVAFPEDN